MRLSSYKSGSKLESNPWVPPTGFHCLWMIALGASFAFSFLQLLVSLKKKEWCRGARYWWNPTKTNYQENVFLFCPKPRALRSFFFHFILYIDISLHICKCIYLSPVMFFFWRRTTWQQKGKELKCAFLLYWTELPPILIGNCTPLS